MVLLAQVAKGDRREGEGIVQFVEVLEAEVGGEFAHWVRLVVRASPDESGISAERRDLAPVEPSFAECFLELGQDWASRIGAIDGVVGLGDADAVFGESFGAVLVKRLGEELLGERAIFFFVDVGGIYVDRVVFLRWIFDECEGVFEKDGCSGVLKCAVVEFGIVSLASVDDHFIDFDHMDGGKGFMATQFAEEGTVPTADNEGGLRLIHTAEGDVSKRFMVGVFVKFGKLDVTVEEEHAAEFG